MHLRRAYNFSLVDLEVIVSVHQNMVEYWLIFVFILRHEVVEYLLKQCSFYLNKITFNSFYQIYTPQQGHTLHKITTILRQEIYKDITETIRRREREKAQGSSLQNVAT